MVFPRFSFCVTAPFILTVVFSIAGEVLAEGWKTYRADSHRSGKTLENLTLPLALRWVFEPLHAPLPAWPPPAEEEPRVHSDNAYHVTSDEGVVYLGLSMEDRVVALDAESGSLLWDISVDGPVRFAPSIWKGKAYFGSDDGYVYCVDGKTGDLQWKHRPGPSGQMVVGNGRVISRWPIRTSVLVDDGVVYFGAGVFPHEGIYITALDARDGTPLWKNDTLGDRAHELTYGGISPQGYLVASSNILYVPSGRAMPVALDRKSGDFLFYCSPADKVGGTWTLLDEGELVAGVDKGGKPAKIAFDAETGSRKGDAFALFPGLDMVATPDVSYTLTKNGIAAIDRSAYQACVEGVAKLKKKRDQLSSRLRGLRRTQSKARETSGEGPSLEEITKELADLSVTEERLSKAALRWSYKKTGLSAIVLAGNTLFAGGEGEVVGMDAESGEPVWNVALEGCAVGLAVSEGGLFVSTKEGPVYCFNSQPTREQAKRIKSVPPVSHTEEDPSAAIYASAADTILKESGVSKGYCLVLGCEEGKLAYELAKKSELRVVGIEKDPEKIRAARMNLSTSGFDSAKISIHAWSLSDLPEYFANLVVSEEMVLTGRTTGLPEEVSQVLRPCGGVALFGQPEESGGSLDGNQLIEWMRGIGGSKIEAVDAPGTWAKAIRGPLEGVGSWTNLYGTPQNTACSGDDLARSPFEVLWFGEPGSQGIVDRHSRAAGALSIGGRLFMQGSHLLMAFDAYNGTPLWRREIPGAIRVRADVDGSNLTATEEAVFVALQNTCLRLDPVTGETQQVYNLPPSADGSPRRWGYVSCVGKTLLGSSAAPFRSNPEAMWGAIVDDGRWKKLDEIPEEYSAIAAPLLRHLSIAFPEPNREAFKQFQSRAHFLSSATQYPHEDSEEGPAGAVTPRMLVSDTVFALDVDTGELLWSHQGDRIAHITLVVGEGTVLFAESSTSPEQKQEALANREGNIKSGVYKAGREADLGQDDLDIRLLQCLDLGTGAKIWEKPIDFTGCGGDKMGLAYQTVEGEGVVLAFGHFGNHDRKLFKDGDLQWRRIIGFEAKTGDVVWSRPLNYLRRPVVVGDDLIIEPRSLNIKTGKINVRTNPISGEEVPYEFLRPGHSCGVTTASSNSLFYRSWCVATTDLERDSGLELFGAIRPGCWVDTISANGLLLLPEASSGCTCSFPVRCSLALKPKELEADTDWTVFIGEGPISSVQNLAVNFGAPGDMKDSDSGTLWFGYPRPETVYGIKFDLQETVLPGMGFFSRDFRGVRIAGSDDPWLFTTGCVGLRRIAVPLVDDIWEKEPAEFTVRLGFSAPERDTEGSRVFDVRIGDEVVLENFDVFREVGATNRAVVKEFKGLSVQNHLAIELVPKVNNPSEDQTPIINFLEAIRETPLPITSAFKEPAGIAKHKAEEMLESANTDLAEGESARALNIYNTVFDSASDIAIRTAALDGMARIGAPESLEKIAPYVRNAAPILWDYNLPPPDFLRATERVYVSVAGHIAESAPGKAARMFENSLAFPLSLDQRSSIIDKLGKLGVEIDSKVADEGYLTRWHLAGPFPWDDQKYGVDRVLVGEPDISLDGTYEVEGRTIEWQSYTSGEAKIDLAALYMPNENVSAYAYTEFVFPEERDIAVRIGSDNGSKTWLNGEVIGQTEGHRLYVPDQDVHFVKAKPGVNRLLVKIYQRGIEWEFSVRLTGPEGTPIRPVWPE